MLQVGFQVGDSQRTGRGLLARLCQGLGAVEEKVTASVAACRWVPLKGRFKAVYQVCFL